MDFQVIQKYMRISPFKARKVANLIRGKMVDDALATLKFLPKKSSFILEKAIKSAVANAEQNQNPVAPEDLFIKSILVDEGPTMKRINFRAQGRVYRVRKRMSHIKLILSEIKKKTAPPKKISKASK